MKDRIRHLGLRFSHSEASGGPKRRSDACMASCTPPLVLRRIQIQPGIPEPGRSRRVCADRIQSKSSFRQLLEVFWKSHDSRQAFGQGPDVGNQYRSIIFTNGTEEARLAAFSKGKEQTRSKHIVVTTQIQQLGKFYRAEAEHQKFELKLNQFLLQLIGNVPEEELEMSVLATKLNGYAADLWPPRI